MRHARGRGGEWGGGKEGKRRRRRRKERGKEGRRPEGRGKGEGVERHHTLAQFHVVFFLFAVSEDISVITADEQSHSYAFFHRICQDSTLDGECV